MAEDVDLSKVPPEEAVLAAVSVLLSRAAVCLSATEPDVAGARLCIDAAAAACEVVKDRLGERGQSIDELIAGLKLQVARQSVR